MVSDTIEVPICIAGGVTAAPPSLCFDNATQIINTPIFGSVRLLPMTKEVEKFLKQHEDSENIVIACGYPRRTTNCSHLEVTSAGLAADFAPKIRGIS